MTTTIGIDVSKASLDVILLKAGRSYHHQVANHSTGYCQLVNWLKKHDAMQGHVCMEATGSYSLGIAKHLVGTTLRVSIVNPVRIKAYAESLLRRYKTDKGDAWVIAEFCRTQQPGLWQPLPEAIQSLQALNRRLADLQQMRTQEINRKEGLDPSASQLASINRHLEFIEQEISTMNQQLAAHIEQSPMLKQQHDLLITIIGVGDKSAGQILAEIPDIARFTSAKQLVAYAGLSPRHKLSGTSLRGRSRMVKIGNAQLRKALYFPALSAMYHNPHLKRFAERLLADGKPKMLVVGAVMRKLLCLIHAILKSGQPYDKSYPSQT